jgi:hypothetical protein
MCHLADIRMSSNPKACIFSLAAFCISDLGGFTLHKSEIIRLEVLFGSIILGLATTWFANRGKPYQTNNKRKNNQTPMSPGTSVVTGSVRSAYHER